MHKADKSQTLFFVLGGFFIANALIAELIGGKLFSVEETLGFEPLDLQVLGQEHLSLTMSAGSILWPFVFVFTDVINEYFGQRGVRFLSFLTAGLIGYAFVMIYGAMRLHPSAVWFSLNPDIQPDINYAFQKVFGQGLSIIIGSITAFLVSQLLDVWIFRRLRALTGAKYIGLRALGSTVVSQLIDSFLVSFIAFYLLGNWTMELIFALLIVSYPYKFVVAVLMTPLLYLIHGLIERYLGADLAEEMKRQAAA